MTVPTVILPRDNQRAHHWVDNAPAGVVVKFYKPKRTIPQNDRMWAMLTDVASQATHNGQKYSPDQWKCLFMDACGHEVAFMQGLSGDWFPAGFKSSKLNKEQMGELMDFIEAWAAQNGVTLKDPTQ
ncbi:recombination protein NinB [Halocynthiibacter sp. C4]|uniref:recombination protein NinB n=1 Tax=Halocynthiibacter sp. C4 TaxID=2992758 RepID=UPI00237AC66C|nr:recombination protein NinB [Halocynthiibacter sp. C4]MDE0590449.1 recombination protein NinB [Halocynthiibacter sp. C4]